jgi:hypothetical protein
VLLSQVQNTTLSRDLPELVTLLFMSDVRPRSEESVVVFLTTRAFLSCEEVSEVASVTLAIGVCATT